MAAKKKEKVPTAKQWNQGNPLIADSDLPPAARARAAEINARLGIGGGDASTPAPMITRRSGGKGKGSKGGKGK